MKRKKLLITAVLLAIAAICAIWRLSPRSLQGILGIEADKIYNVSCSSLHITFSEGSPSMTVHSISVPDSDSEHGQAVIDILFSSSYRRDFRNFLPFPVSSAGANEGITKTANIAFSLDNPAGDFCYISFLSDRLVALSLSGQEGYTLLHPVDSGVLDRLAEYIKLHGEEK